MNELPEPLDTSARRELQAEQLKILDRSLRSRRRKRRRRRSPEKRRVHEVKLDGGAVVALYSDRTWGYLWRPDGKEYR